jgi:acyl-CoA thioesterase
LFRRRADHSLHEENIAVAGGRTLQRALKDHVMDALTTAATPFSDILDQLTREVDIFRARASDDWQQGRTLFGGLSSALAVAAARRLFPDLPPLRSAQFAFVGPATGDLELMPRLVRRGKSSAFVAVEAISNSEIALNAMLMFGSERRSSHCYRALPMPHVSPPGALPDFFDAPFAPNFSHQFDGKFAGGARAVSGAEKPELLLWIRHRDHAAPDDVTSAIALGDLPPPAAMTMFAAPAPISTVTWSIDVLADKFAGTGWHLIHVEADVVGGGYSSQRMTMWDAAGVPVLAARQTVAVFG